MSPQDGDTVLRAMERVAQIPDKDRPASGKNLLFTEHSVPQVALAHLRLGEVMVQLQMLTSEQQQHVLLRQAGTTIPFGECALRLNLITPKQLEQALAAQFAYSVPVIDDQPFTRDLVAAHTPFGGYSEAIRTVASRLMSQWWTPTNKAITITSAAPREGRSHVAANLAVAVAQFGRRTLLIDADLRNPRQHKIFGVSQHPGLSRILCGVISDELVRPVSFSPNLSLITAGPTPPNAVELLSREEFGTLLRHAQRSFDMVIVDSPSSTQHVDIEIIAKATGSALIVSSENRTRLRPLNALKESLTNSGVNIAGIVINAA